MVTKYGMVEEKVRYIHKSSKKAQKKASLWTRYNIAYKVMYLEESHVKFVGVCLHSIIFNAEWCYIHRSKDKVRILLY